MNHIKEIIAKLSEKNIQFIVCGGVAAVLHGVERMTVDIDLSIDRSQENLESFLEVIAELGLMPRAPIPGEVLLDDTQVQKLIDEKNAIVFSFIDSENPYRQVDVFLTNEYDFHNLKEHVIIVNFEEQPLKVLSKSKLIDLKSKVRPVRDKDVSDIKELNRIIETEQSEGK